MQELQKWTANALFFCCCKVSTERKTSLGHLTPPQMSLSLQVKVRKGLKVKKHNTLILSSLVCVLIRLAWMLFLTRHANHDEDEGMKQNQACDQFMYYCISVSVNAIQSEHVLKACGVASIQEAPWAQPLLLIAQPDRAIFWQQFVWQTPVRKFDFKLLTNQV